MEHDAAHNWDVVVSFVLYKTDPAEVQRAVEQVQAARCRTFVALVDNTVPAIDLPQFDPRHVALIRSGANLGYGRGHNRALEWSRGKSRCHIVMNTDLTYEGSVIDRLVEFMDRNPGVGLAMPKVCYPDGRIQRLCRLLPSPIDLMGRRFFPRAGWAARRNAIYEFHDWDYESIASFPFLSGCFMMMRRDMVERAGGFDERFFLYAEDLDLSRRLHAISQTVYYPEVEVVHEYRSEQRRGLLRILYGIRSLSQYFNKWGWFFDRDRDRINSKTVDALRSGMVDLAN